MKIINIQIGGKPHKDGQIDNPEFYYQAMDIINKHKLASEQAIKEREQGINKTTKQETNIWVYVIAVIIVCLLFLR